MNRRDFMAAGLGAAAAGAAAEAILAETAAASADPAIPGHPRDARLAVKPVMVNLVHSGVWQGPCRWTSITPEAERSGAGQWFAGWSKQLREKGLGRPDEVRLLEPAQLIFSENWKLGPDQLAKLAPDAPQTDAFFIVPAGNSRSSFEIGDLFRRPVVLDGLSCRNTDIASLILAKGNEVYVAGEDVDLAKTFSLLRARKVFRQTKVLYPTDGVAPFSVGNPWDFEGMEKRLGLSVVKIPYREMSAEMERLLGDPAEAKRAEQAAAALVRGADRSFLDARFVARTMTFDRCLRNLMVRHGCNAFTIDCFEFCPALLPQKWMVVPCLQHALFGNEGIASSCEADFGILLALRMLMSVSNKSCHQGNSDPRPGGAFRINHSAASMKMNGFDKPGLPYQLGRFVEQGWGTKALVDFMKNDEKIVTVARVDPTATRLLALRGTLVGASGWGEDQVGCSVEAVIQPPPGRSDEFLRRRMVYGNHLPWVYGDYIKELRTLGEMLGLTVEAIA